MNILRMHLRAALDAHADCPLDFFSIAIDWTFGDEFNPGHIPQLSDSRVDHDRIARELRGEFGLPREIKHGRHRKQPVRRIHTPELA